MGHPEESRAMAPSGSACTASAVTVKRRYQQPQIHDQGRFSSADGASALEFMYWR